MERSVEIENVNLMVWGGQSVAKKRGLVIRQILPLYFAEITSFATAKLKNGSLQD
jgi:hypothetical protein